MKRRAFSLTEVLMALGILAMVLCGALVFLQTSLVFYRRQMNALAASFTAQSLLASATKPERGHIGQLDYTLDIDKAGWAHLDLRQGAASVARPILRQPVERLLWFQDYASQQWLEVDAESCAEQTLEQQAIHPVAEAGGLSWKGRVVYRDSSPLREPQLDPERHRIAFIQGSQVLVLDLDRMKTSCWFTGRNELESISWLEDGQSVAVQDGNRLLKISARRQTVLYDGPALQQPSVSPDASQIAFIDRQDGSNDLFVYDCTAKQARPVMATPDGEIRPLWSRDGQRILYGVAPEAGGTRLFCGNSDGSGLQDLHIEASGRNWSWK